MKAYRNQRFLLQSSQILHHIPYLTWGKHCAHGGHGADRAKALRHLRVWIDQAVEQPLAVIPVSDARKARGRVTAGAFHHVAAETRCGETFVTRKITRAVGRIKLGMQKKLYLGNLGMNYKDFIAIGLELASREKTLRDAGHDVPDASGHGH